MRNHRSLQLVVLFQGKRTLPIADAKAKPWDVTCAISVIDTPMRTWNELRRHLLADSSDDCALSLCGFIYPGHCGCGTGWR